MPKESVDPAYLERENALRAAIARVFGDVKGVTIECVKTPDLNIYPEGTPVASIGADKFRTHPAHPESLEIITLQGGWPVYSLADFTAWKGEPE